MRQSKKGGFSAKRTRTANPLHRFRYPRPVLPGRGTALLCFLPPVFLLYFARHPRLTCPVSARCEHEQIVFVHLLRSEHEPLINVSFDLRTSSKPAPLQHPQQLGIHLQLSKPNDTNRNMFSHTARLATIDECLRPLWFTRRITFPLPCAFLKNRVVHSMQSYQSPVFHEQIQHPP